MQNENYFDQLIKNNIDLLQNTLLLAYLWFEAVHNLVSIKTDYLNLNTNPLNLGQKLFFKIFWNFQIYLE